jgi:hypothetical protein
MVAVCRPFDGITINTEVEYLLDEDGEIKKFKDVETAKKWLREHGITEEIMEFLMFVSVEDGDVWVSF